MVRAYGSVAAVAAAVLAIIIGVIAFNASSDDQHARPPGGGQAGAPAHSSGIEDLFNRAFDDLLNNSPLEPVEAAEPPRDEPPPRVSATFSGGGGGGGVPAPVARSCNPGLVASLLATLGGLLGGSGSAC